MTKKRILIANPSKDLLEPLLHLPAMKKYHVETASNGPDCLHKVKTFAPDLILMDLLLPEMHAIEILKTLKSHPKTKKIGVIISSDHCMIQNYHAAITEGADYFLHKPCDLDFIPILFQRFFTGALSPDPFLGKESTASETHAYHPPQEHDAYLKLWGTRGSTPVSGPEYVRFGGNTSCLELRCGSELVIIDAGTGIRALGKTLLHTDVKTIHLLIGHTHWDHITGFPFFAPLYDPECHVCIWAPSGFEKTAKELFTEMLAYAYFPVRLDDIQAKLIFKTLHSEEPIAIGDIAINTHYTYHPGETLGFKIKVGKKTFGYITDNEMLMGYHGDPKKIKKDDARLLPYQGLIKFLKPCDFLIHEAQYTPEEYLEKVGWGHSSMSNAAVLIKHCGIKEWIITHHDPRHTDEELIKKQLMQRNIIEDCKLSCHVQMAYDGLVIPL